MRTDRRSEVWVRLVMVIVGMCLLSVGAALALNVQPLAAALPEEPASGGEQWIDPIEITIAPDMVRIEPDETVTLTIWVHDVESLGGFQYDLRFDPRVLEIVDQNPVRPGVQIGAAGVFEGMPSYEGHNIANNETGVITHAMSLLVGQPFTGTGTLGTITVRGKEQGISSLWFARELKQWPAIVFSSSGISSGWLIPSIWGQAIVSVGTEPNFVYLPLIMSN
jgi:hypothetical protein